MTKLDRGLRYLQLGVVIRQAELYLKRAESEPDDSVPPAVVETGKNFLAELQKWRATLGPNA